MADNNATDVRLDANSNGTVYFASDVVATIAGLAVTEVEGVANTVGVSNGFAEIFSRRGQGNARNLTRGVKVEVTNNEVAVDVTIIVEYGSPVPEVAGGIQENVKKAIETMTGMSVSRVDVHVAGVSFERENRAVAELEMHQRKLLEKKPARDEAPEPEKEQAPEPEGEQAPADADNEACAQAPAEAQDAEAGGESACEDALDEPEDDDDFELILEEPEPEDETPGEDKAAEDAEQADEAQEDE